MWGTRTTLGGVCFRPRLKALFKIASSRLIVALAALPSAGRRCTAEPRSSSPDAPARRRKTAGRAAGTLLGPVVVLVVDPIVGENVLQQSADQSALRGDLGSSQVPTAQRLALRTTPRPSCCRGSSCSRKHAFPGTAACEDTTSQILYRVDDLTCHEPKTSIEPEVLRGKSGWGDPAPL